MACRSIYAIGKVGNQEVSHEHEGEQPETFNFSGDSDLFIYDVRYSYKNLVLTGEYFTRTETGNLTITGGRWTEPEAISQLNEVDSSGWYISRCI